MQTVKLTDYQYMLCKLFSAESAKTQQRHEFGEKATLARSLNEIARDNLIGKMAEAAIANVLHEFGEHRPVNYEVYPVDECDDEDFEVNGWTLDIKSTRAGRYMLLEYNKVNYRWRTGTLPDLIVMCRTPWDGVNDEPLLKSVDVIGCISTAKLLDKNNVRVLRLKAGECIPGTQCRLQTGNYAIRFEDLADFNKTVEYMLKHKPHGNPSKKRERGKC